MSATTERFLQREERDFAKTRARDGDTDAPASASPKTHPNQLPLFPPASCTAYCFDPSNQNTCFCDYEEYNPNP